MRLRDLRGLGPKSEDALVAVGIETPTQLRETGPIPAFAALCEHDSKNANLNFLYALVAAIEDRDWLDVARNERGRLLLELEAWKELEILVAEQRAGECEPANGDPAQQAPSNQKHRGPS